MKPFSGAREIIEIVDEMPTVLLIHSARALLLVGAEQIAADHLSHHTFTTRDFFLKVHSPKQKVEGTSLHKSLENLSAIILCGPSI